MLTRPQLKYVEENLMSALRKSKTLRMSPTKLMSVKMAKLSMVMTMPQQGDVMIEPRKDCSRTRLRFWNPMKAQPDQRDHQNQTPSTALMTMT
jgi:hypothetical protein